jgi:hypothetical protein
MICTYCNLQAVTYPKSICQQCESKCRADRMKRCNNCEQLKSWDEFTGNENTKSLFNLEPKCKCCKSAYNVEQWNKPEAFLKSMLASCVHSNTLRNQRGRDLVMTWTYEDMVEKLEELDYKCAYSGIKMNLRFHSDWKASPERIDNTKSYVKDNMTFICLEFQLGQQLQSSSQLVQALSKVDESPHPRIGEIIAGKFKDALFVKHCSGGIHECNECRSEYAKHYRNTVLGRLTRLAGSARARTKRRNISGRNHKYDIDAQYLLKLLQEQKGKCAISQHHLMFETGKYNCISLERKDVNLGYVKGNVSLVLQCFNTMDCRSVKSFARQLEVGSGGWTSKKFAFFKKHMDQKK